MIITEEHMLMFGCRRQTWLSRSIQISCDSFCKKLFKTCFYL